VTQKFETLAARLQEGRRDLNLAALGGAAKLFREFGENYRQQFGKDGIEDGIERMARVESLLGLSDLASYTTSPPPQR
jgi:hypothetical protein